MLHGFGQLCYTAGYSWKTANLSLSTVYGSVSAYVCISKKYKMCAKVSIILLIEERTRIETTVCTFAL